MSDYSYMDAAVHVFAPKCAGTSSEERKRIMALLEGMPRVGGSEYALGMNVKISHDEEHGWKIGMAPCGIMRDRRREDAVRQWRELLEFLRRTFNDEPVEDYVCITENMNVWFKHQEKRAKRRKGNER